MYDCVILYRVGDGPVQFVAEEDGSLAIYPDIDKAVTYVENNKLFQSGQADHQIVVLDEL